MVSLNIPSTQIALKQLVTNSSVLDRLKDKYGTGSAGKGVVFAIDRGCPQRGDALSEAQQ